MKHKKLLSLCLIALMTSLTAWYFLKNSKKVKQVQTQNQNLDQKKNISKSASHSHQEKKIKQSQMIKKPNHPIVNRTVNRSISSTQDVPKNLVITNKFNPNWQKRYLKNITRSFFDEKVKVDIKHLRSLVYVKYNKGRLAEKVKVSITRENGRSSSYTALVDAQTGSLINSWNPTRYEFKEKLTLDGRGAEFTP